MNKNKIKSSSKLKHLNLSPVEIPTIQEGVDLTEFGQKTLVNRGQSKFYNFKKFRHEQIKCPFREVSTENKSNDIQTFDKNPELRTLNSLRSPCNLKYKSVDKSLQSPTISQKSPALSPTLQLHNSSSCISIGNGEGIRKMMQYTKNPTNKQLPREFSEAKIIADLTDKDKSSNKKEKGTEWYINWVKKHEDHLLPKPLQFQTAKTNVMRTELKKDLQNLNTLVDQCKTWRGDQFKKQKQKEEKLINTARNILADMDKIQHKNAEQRREKVIEDFNQPLDIGKNKSKADINQSLINVKEMYNTLHRKSEIEKRNDLTKSLNKLKQSSKIEREYNFHQKELIKK